MKMNLFSFIKSVSSWWKKEITPLPKKIKIGFLICLLTGAGLIKFYEFSYKKIHISVQNFSTLNDVEEKEQRIAVTEYNVEPRDIIEVFNVFGHIKPLKEVQISSENKVSVTNVFVKWGQKVKKGQLLFEVDSRIHQLKTKLQFMENSIQQKELNTLETLAKKEIISKNEYLQKKQEIESFKIKNQIAKLESGAGKILSPIDGVVAEIKMKVGDFVDDPQKFYIKVVDNSELKFETWVPLEIGSKLKVGDHVDFEWKRAAARLGEDDIVEVETGEIDGISPMIDANSGTIMVTVSLKEKFNDWKSGIYVKASFPLDKKQKILAIKNSSLIYEKGNTFAYRIIASEGEKFSQAEKVELKLGISDGEYSEVVEGLNPSEKVVDKGVGTVNSDILIEVIK